MKNILFFLVIICTYSSYGQSLDCCQSKAEVKDHLVGIWQKDDTFVKYEYIDGDLKSFDVEFKKVSRTYKKVKYGLTFLVEIEEFDWGFGMVEYSQYGPSAVKIKFLDDNKLITTYKSNEYEYLKISSP